MQLEIFEVIIDFLRKCKKTLILVFLVALLRNYLSIVLLPILLKNAFNIFYSNTGNFHIYIDYLLLYYGIYFINNFLSYVDGYIKVNYTQKNYYLFLLKSIFNKVIYNSVTFFNFKHSNIIVDYLEKISANILYIVQAIFATLIPNIIILLIYIYNLKVLKIYKFIIFWCLIYSLILVCFSKQTKKFSQNSVKSSYDLSSEIDNILVNITNVKSFSNEIYETNNIENYIKNEFQNKKKLNNFNILIDFIRTFIDIVFNLILFIFLIKNFIAGNFGVDTLFFIFYTVQRVVIQNSIFIREIIVIFETITIIKVYFLELNDKNLIKNYKNNELIIDKGFIDIRSISFKYKEDLPLILSNFSLYIPSNQKLGLVGYSGAGKTTLINLLLRFYDVNEGGIYIDNQNIKTDITQESLRNNISYVSQDLFLFNRSVRDNIIYGKLNATEEEIIEATKKANCFEFINNLENKFDTLVGERGIKLSGGQRQRIAIARAILKNSKILILDEATSALDSITEKEIQIALNNLMQNKTVIVIAHRLSTLNIMDRIVAIDKGQIKEDGTKEELLNKEDGLFKKMWDMQKEGVIGGK